MRSGIAVAALMVCLVLGGCANKPTNKEATTLPPPPPLESEPMPGSLSAPPVSVAPAPLPPAQAPSQWDTPVLPAAPAASSNGAYVVQKGDTLYSIARRMYGSGDSWHKIADANGITDPRKLRVGQELILP